MPKATEHPKRVFARILTERNLTIEEAASLALEFIHDRGLDGPFRREMESIEAAPICGKRPLYSKDRCKRRKYHGGDCSLDRNDDYSDSTYKVTGGQS
jgi:hypothetical protein